MSLTPKNPDTRRASERVDAKIEVQFKNGNEYIACYSQNLSKGGIYLETETLPDPNAVIELLLSFPNEIDSPASGNQELMLKGRVVRLMSVSVDGKPIHKVAIQFLEIPPEIHLKLDSLFEYFERAKS